MPPDLLETLGEIGIRVLVAAAVLLVARIFAGLGRRLIKKLTGRPNVARNLGPSMRSLLSGAVYVVVLVAGAMIALSVVGVPQNVLVWVVGLILVVLAVALSRSLGNLAATVIFIIFQPFKLGEDIETMGVRGEVEDIQLFNTVIRQFDHTIASLANGAMQEAGILNHSRSGIHWAPVDVTVSYGQDLARIRDLILDVLAADPRVLETPPPDVVVVRLDPHGVVLQAQPTVRHSEFWPTLSELHAKISTRLQDEGVAVAVPPEVPIRLQVAPAVNDRSMAP